MSRTHTETIRCPECGESDEFTIYESINVTNDPKLKQALLERELTTFACPKCRYEVQISSDLLYHDMRKKIFVWLKYPDDDVTQRHAPLRRETADGGPVLADGRIAFSFRRQLREEVCGREARAF